MATVWLVLRADARRRWRALLSLTLLLGITGGVVLTAAAGAQRTDTAYPRLLRWANATQLNVVLGGTDPGMLAALARLPQVAAMSSVIQYNMGLPAPHGALDLQVNVLSSPDGTLGGSVDRIKILRGRMFSPRSADEAVVDPLLASTEHLQPGDTLRMIAVPYTDNGQGELDLRHAYPIAFRVTGIGVFDDQVVPTTTANSEPRVLLSPAFSRLKPAYSHSVAPASDVYLPEAGVRLRPGASVAAFSDAVRTLAKRYPPEGGGFPGIVNLSDEVTATERAIRPQAVALAVFAGLAGLISLVVLGQLLARQLTMDSAEFPVLRALGMTRASLLVLSLARLALVTITGALIAAAAAVAASPLMPIGSARLAEPSPGIEVNLAILAGGAAVIALLPLLVLTPAVFRVVSHVMGPLGIAEPPVPANPSRLVMAITRAGPAPSGIGARMALQPGRGRTAVPARSAIAGSAVAVAAVLAAAVFGASLIGLVSTPHRYGQNWDQELNLGFAIVPPALGAKVLSADPAVTGYAEGNNGQLTVDGKMVPAIGVDPVSGSGYLTLLAGQPLAGPGDIVLGAQTMRALGLRLGQTVRVAVNVANGTPGTGATRTLRVTGAAVFPDFGLPGLSDTDLGNGAVVATSLLSTVQLNTGCNGHITCYSFFLVRYRPGTDTGSAGAKLIAAATAAGCPLDVCTVTEDQRPGDIRNYAGIRDTPLALGAVLVMLAVGTLAHVLLTSVRYRRRDLAILKALGFTRSHIQGVVAWQASVLAAAALLIGIPLGIVAGRWAWAVFANTAGVSTQPSVPLALVLVAIPATLLLANVIAAWPGRTAARLRPATVLRTE
jgi:ABC-type antimicrobial peptide transport system permease subunit